MAGCSGSRVLLLALMMLVMQDQQVGPLGRYHLPQTVVPNVLAHWPIVGGEKKIIVY